MNDRGLMQRDGFGDLLVTGSGRRLSQNDRCHRSLEVGVQRRERDP